MATAVALDTRDYQGLTDFETRLATALMHGRLRTAFSQIHPRSTDVGGTILEVWGRTPSNTPDFVIQRQGDCIVAVSDGKEIMASSESIEGLVTKISTELPPPFPF